MTRRTDDTEWSDVQDAALLIVREVFADASPEFARFECRQTNGRWEVRRKQPFMDIGAVLADLTKFSR